MNIQKVTSKDDIDSETISAKILFPLFALHSVFFYFFVVCGGSLFSDISFGFQNLYTMEATVRSSKMNTFSRICAFIFLAFSIRNAIKYSNRISTSNLVYGMIILSVVFSILQGAFFILSFIIRAITKRLNRNNKSITRQFERTKIEILLILVVLLSVFFLIAAQAIGSTPIAERLLPKITEESVIH